VSYTEVAAEFVNDKKKSISKNKFRGGAIFFHPFFHVRRLPPLGATSECSPAEISRQGAAVTAVSGGNRVGGGVATEAGAATRSCLPFAAKAVTAEEEGATLREISASIATDWNGVAIIKINK
jgi:hypothetical protein